jgi:hypothetical protein
MKTPTVAVFPAVQFFRYRRLLESLSELYSIQFEPREEGDWAACAGALLLGVDRMEALRVANLGLRCMAWVKAELTPVKLEAADLSFAPVPYLARCFRGRTLADRSINMVRRLQAGSGDNVVARKGEAVLWIHRTVERAALDLLALDPPDLAEGEYPYQFLQRDNCMRLLPLLHFLRGLSPWERPPLRACLMFDDPNLHWKTYGCVRFEELVGHAARNNYHVSFATVPFDGWYVHPPTAALFQKNGAKLSLLVHGNNHTFAELARPYPNGHRQILMAQALQRIQRMEKRSGVSVSRVMAAPHGGCTSEMARALLQVGFEAACISRWSLMHYNPVAWYPTIGLNVAEFLASSFPVIPRFKLALEREVDVYLASLLEKPIILVGHHDDLSCGLDLLEHFAARINSLGEVKWLDMTAMARSNFSTHREGEVLHLKLHSRRVQLIVPPGVRAVLVHRAWPNPEEGEAFDWRAGNAEYRRIDADRAEAIPVVPGTEVEIGAVFPSAIDPHRVPAPRASIWAAARRGVCEIRDRSEPVLARLRKSISRPS